MIRLVHASGSIRIPVKRASKMNQLRQWVEAFTAREGRSPTDQEAMEGMEISAADLRILRQAAAVRQVASLDALMCDVEWYGGDTLIATVAAPTTTADTTTTERAQVLEALEPWPDLREIMGRRLAGHTCQEAGQAMGITRLAAERLWERALAMAQHLMTSTSAAGGQVELLVTEIEIEQQLLLFPLTA
jgi:DNA-directed RNA polymerase specialized sigma subunit